jgi:hypothetical protein
MRGRVRVWAALAGLMAGGVAVGVSGSPAAADGPGVGTPTIVTVGDSYISGEAGRWAGNTNKGSQYHDATGPTTYYDNASNTAEQIARCHRSKSAEAYIGGGVIGVNLACSGARTSTFFDSDGNFKPGLDRYSDSAGRKSQVLLLEDVARARNVKMVVVSIGGNNFNFADIVQRCVSNFLLSPSWWPDYCYDDSSVRSNFTSTNVSNQTAAIRQAILNVRQGMTNAGYADSMYTILVQTYPSPIPNGSGFRYSQSGYTRQSTGGCGFWNRDADWANASALPTINGAVRNAASGTKLTNVRILELASSMNGRRLCENTVGLLEERSLASWTSPGAVDKTEWINQIRTLTTVFGPYFVQESIHPNYWGQLAVRNCVRQAYTLSRGGTCVRGSGQNTLGEPNMALN